MIHGIHPTAMVAAYYDGLESSDRLELLTRCPGACYAPAGQAASLAILKFRQLKTERQYALAALILLGPMGDFQGVE